WVVSQRHDADPSGAPLIRQAMVYAALAATDGDYTGNYDGVSLAAAPFPIPITFKGTFRLYRLTGEPKPRGLLARLLDALAGCAARGNRYRTPPEPPCRSRRAPPAPCRGARGTRAVGAAPGPSRGSSRRATASACRGGRRARSCRRGGRGSPPRRPARGEGRA